MFDADPFGGPFNLSLATRNNIFVAATIGYLYYRSIAKPTFDLNPFCVDPSDIWGLVFIASFAVTKRRSVGDGFAPGASEQPAHHVVS